MMKGYVYYCKKCNEKLEFNTLRLYKGWVSLYCPNCHRIHKIEEAKCSSIIKPESSSKSTFLKLGKKIFTSGEFCNKPATVLKVNTDSSWTYQGMVTWKCRCEDHFKVRPFLLCPNCGNLFDHAFTNSDEYITLDNGWIKRNCGICNFPVKIKEAKCSTKLADGKCDKPGIAAKKGLGKTKYRCKEHSDNSFKKVIGKDWIREEDWRILEDLLGLDDLDPILSDLIKNTGDVVREATVKKIEDQKLLHWVTQNDNNSWIRNIATSKLTCQETLAHIASNDVAWGVRVKAVEKLENNRILVDISKNDKEWTVRSEAKKRLKELKK